MPRGRHIGQFDVGTALIAAYVLTVALFALTSHAIGEPEVPDLASSPQKIADGQVWTLLSSAFLVDGPPVVQIAAVAVLAAVLVRFRGSFVFWRAALAGHVTATVLTYAGVGALWVLDRSATAGVVTSPDYGISCVWAGGLGAVAAGAWGARGRAPRAQAVVVGSVSMLAGLTAFSTGLAQVEHVLAFALGALVIVATDHRRRPADRFRGFSDAMAEPEPVAPASRPSARAAARGRCAPSSRTPRAWRARGAWRAG